MTPGVLCKFADYKSQKSRVKKTLTPKIMVPTLLREKIQKMLHDDIPSGGHVYIDAPNTKVTSKFYWTSTGRICVKYLAVSACVLHQCT